MNYTFAPQWTPQEIANIRMQGIAAQADRARYPIHRIPSVMTKTDPAVAALAYRALRAAYHARAWR